MELVKTNYNYDFIVANEYLCIPACLEMILRIYSINLSQNDIGEHFGLNVLPDYRGPIKNIKCMTDPNSLGIILKMKSVNDFFKKFNIPLVEKYYSIKTLQDWMFEDLLSEKLASRCHIICGFNYGVLYNDEDKQQIGHVALVEAVDIRSVTITILDPGPLNAGRKQLDIIDLYRAIHYKNDGAWVISKMR